MFLVLCIPQHLKHELRDAHRLAEQKDQLEALHERTSERRDKLEQKRVEQRLEQMKEPSTQVEERQSVPLVTEPASAPTAPIVGTIIVESTHPFKPLHDTLADVQTTLDLLKPNGGDEQQNAIVNQLQKAVKVREGKQLEVMGKRDTHRCENACHSLHPQFVFLS